MAIMKKGVAGAKLANAGKPAAKPAESESETKTKTEAESESAPVKQRVPPPTKIQDHSEGANDPNKGSDDGEGESEAQETTRAMAPRASTGTEVSKASGGAMMRGAEAAEPDGFEDLDNEIGFGSFPIMKLDNGTFEINDVDVGTSVLVIMQQSRAKHLYKQGGVEDTEYVVYSYDEKHDTGGRLLESVFDEWANEGVDRNSIEHKKYSEAVALVLQDCEFKGQLVLLSVPPASIKRMAGYRAELKVMRRGATPQQVVTRCEVGKKVKKDNKSFNPWQFRYVRMSTQEDLDKAFAGLDEVAAKESDD